MTESFVRHAEGCLPPETGRGGARFIRESARPALPAGSPNTEYGPEDAR